MDWPSLHWPFHHYLLLDQWHVIWNKTDSGEPPVNPKPKMLSQIPEAEAQQNFHSQISLVHPAELSSHSLPHPRLIHSSRHEEIKGDLSPRLHTFIR